MWSVLPLQELQHQIANFAQERGKRIKAAKDSIATAKKAAEAAKKALKAKQTALQVGRGAAGWEIEGQRARFLHA